MQFKGDNLKQQWNDARLRPDLKQAVALADAYSSTKYNKNIFITSIFRAGYESVHGHWRGIDARVSFGDSLGGLVAHFSVEQANDIAGFINWVYVYSDEHRACIHHGNGGAPGTHLHFQVPTAPHFLSINGAEAMDAFIRDYMTREMTGIGNWG